LEFGPVRWGCRAYLAVAGGIDVPEVMHSRSTYLRAGIGGFEGRALRPGDVLPLGRIGRAVQRIMATTEENLGPLPFALTSRRLRHADRLYRSGPIRFVRGPDWGMLDADERAAFLGATFRVSSESDRMGYRLLGPVLRTPAGAEMISTAVLTGTVQLPPGGEPIVLTADRQTTGGYPILAQVIRADLGTVAQLKPGDEIRFEETTIDEAHRAIRDIEELLVELRGVEERASSGP
jgi:antagonist of KipI